MKLSDHRLREAIEFANLGALILHLPAQHRDDLWAVKEFHSLLAQIGQQLGE